MKTVLLEPVLGDLINIAHFMTGHNQTQLNRVCCFICVLLAFEESYFFLV